ncbi:MarR family transcriptional regulator [Kitasatospora phosalacinea]|uniref:MarR family transcriptional regulator n=1 Tax=Kitasatospora phosalacinea TaxID=2065 RepID=UPI0005260B9D|nr:MarR family transcriptional regulator [Kitasatospora phosalacinea]
MALVPPFPDRADDTATVSSVVELLEVLWGGGREMDARPVSVSQLRVLYVLAESGGINLRTLTGALDSSPSSVSRLCDRLEAAGLVQRTASTTSRRELELHLTPTGLAFLADLRSARERALAEVLDDMSPAERGALLTGLNAFRTAAARRAEAGADVVPVARTA